MDYSKRQEELDLIKWVDSESKNYDTCGEYSYCSNCNKNEAYPCAYAYERYFEAYNANKMLTKSAPRAKRTIKTSTKKSTSTASKSTTRKTSTTRRTTKKASVSA